MLFNMHFICAFIYAALFCLINLTQGEILQFDDITVETKTTNFRCDRIICPSNTHLCVVTKQFTGMGTFGLRKVIRENWCISATDDVLQKSKTIGNVLAGEQTYYRLTVDHNGKVNKYIELRNGRHIYS
ncbi:uncharacterized protein [Musca autumnalis]|uniref:uncharacterized protein n=1 Tax=Musca autumnalis TaxID=221902 RepID=UPI003CE84131